MAWVRIYPPEAFTVCMIGHPNDLFSWTVNHAFGANFFVHEISLEIPLLTALGVLIGGAVAATQHKELKFKLRAEDPVWYFIIGFAVSNFGLMLGYCPIKTLGTVAYGSLQMFIGFIFIEIGAIFACRYIKWRLTR